jgi:hypothetical protein
MSFTFNYECPKCSQKLCCTTGTQPEKEFCPECGTRMTLVSKRGENGIEQEIREEKTKQPEIKPQEKLQIETKEFEVDPKNLKINLDGEVFNAKLPKDLKFRAQNLECNKAGHYCAKRGIFDVCLIPEKHVKDSDGNTPLFEVKPCSKSPKQTLDFDNLNGED